LRVSSPLSGKADRRIAATPPAQEKRGQEEEASRTRSRLGFAPTSFEIRGGKSNGASKSRSRGEIEEKASQVGGAGWAAQV